MLQLRLAALHDLLDRRAPGKALWVTEYAWPTIPAGVAGNLIGVDEETQAAFLVRSMLLQVAQPNVPVAIWTDFQDQEQLGNVIPSLASEIALIGMYGARVLGIALNHEHLAENERAATRERIARETGLPTVYPLLEPLDPLVEVAARYAKEERRA